MAPKTFDQKLVIAFMILIIIGAIFLIVGRQIAVVEKETRYQECVANLPPGEDPGACRCYCSIGPHPVAVIVACLILESAMYSTYKNEKARAEQNPGGIPHG